MKPERGTEFTAPIFHVGKVLLHKKKKSFKILDLPELKDQSLVLKKITTISATRRQTLELKIGLKLEFF